MSVFVPRTIAFLDAWSDPHGADTSQGDDVPHIDRRLAQHPDTGEDLVRREDSRGRTVWQEGRQRESGRNKGDVERNGLSDTEHS